MALPFPAESHSGLQLLCRYFPLLLCLLGSLGHCSRALLPAWNFCLAPGPAPLVGASWSAPELLAPITPSCSHSPRGGKAANPSRNQRERGFSPWLGRHIKGNLATGCHRGAGQRLGEKYSVKPPLSKDLIPSVFPLLDFSAGENRLSSILVAHYACSSLVIGNTHNFLVQWHACSLLSDIFCSAMPILLTSSFPLQLCLALCVSASQWQAYF